MMPKEREQGDLINDYIDSVGIHVKIKHLEYDGKSGKITAYFITEEINPFRDYDTGEYNALKLARENAFKRFMELRLGDAVIIQK